jgi:hypothetical protein
MQERLDLLDAATVTTKTVTEWARELNDSGLGLRPATSQIPQIGGQTLCLTFIFRAQAGTGMSRSHLGMQDSGKGSQQLGQGPSK